MNRDQKIQLLNSIQAGRKGLRELADNRLRWRIKVLPDYIVSWYELDGKEIDYITFSELYEARDPNTRTYVMSDEDFETLVNALNERKSSEQSKLKHGLNLKYEVPQPKTNEPKTKNKSFAEFRSW